MNILIIQNFIAGIFEEYSDAMSYLRQHKGGYIHEVRPLQYPFYIVEIDGRFDGWQTESAALQAAGEGSATIYTITADYQPTCPWTDEMGGLPHKHFGDES